eukprot:CAMPEP_0204860330 /NCGR_PEP_ID=MMETSP1348-20121228/207_1 /ASSEMBLY_ACC=CAM_ASM_000700 /TAXON_ID=215587 /ORGANISM="Aplanochytrium stocchinoi, Strain GSBS06" /LENGTH=64 /DNA_ID=CAMNT_0052009009 /DNA_START=146 /DNA_END=340 /DNA_ORIENTATION=-
MDLVLGNVLGKASDMALDKASDMVLGKALEKALEKALVGPSPGRIGTFLGSCILQSLDLMMHSH